MIDVGALNDLERLIATNVSLAIEAVDTPLIAAEAKVPLVELAEFITSRVS